MHFILFMYLNILKYEIPLKQVLYILEAAVCVYFSYLNWKQESTYRK